ncbi:MULTISPECIES: conjugal transfer protein [Bacillaceae]|uniref:conjugal transfer protein n=1 Tax=Bacillaceae TaxID=186817 RepID=UPI000B62F19C|nr:MULTISPECIES: conjugal transfer protein [Bacillus cereus group]MED3620819.1 conjugal transfer protein [Bacillus thuringiensis]OUB81169.1 hypothetical protein BK788_23965 [Bacillus thuringiensis serovar sinensis]MBJ8024781.1 conjugal transfer protein [Bacillus cereus]MBJ8037186.1 conjugal transfer protein [Bacillus cereus]MDI6680047.1 conjugal transfer protein [Bacillus wiedmannii]
MGKREVPKTVVRRKFMKGAFWTALGLSMCFSLVAVVRAGNHEEVNAKKQPDKVEMEVQQLVGAQTFATNFAHEYFSWDSSDDAKKKRAERLKPYLAEKLDEQAGLNFEGVEWNSSPGKIQVWDAKQQGKDQVYITVSVQQNLKKINAEDKTETTKYFIVPMKTDGKGYVVNEIPYYTNPVEKAKVTEKNDFRETPIMDSVVKRDIQEFLNTFFKVYTTGTNTELEYYTKDKKIKPLQEVVTYQKIKDMRVIQNGDGYKIVTVVIVQDNQSKAKYEYPFTLWVEKEKGRWTVSKLQNQ